MRRRRFLTSVAGVAVASGYRGVSAAQRLHGRIGIVGGGILGTSIALHLARRGAQVTVFEREGPAAGATGNSFAWINANFSKRPRSYFELNWRGIQGWRRLEDELGGDLTVSWGGSLEYRIEADRVRLLHEQVGRSQRWGYPVHWVDEARFHELEPGVTPEASVLGAIWASAEGHIEPRSATRALWAAAEAAGAKFLIAEVNSLDIGYGVLRGVRTSAGDHELDTLVVAAGIQAPELARQAGVEIPLVESPGLLAHSTPAKSVVNRIVLAPSIHVKQAAGGKVVAGVGFAGAGSTDNSRAVGEAIFEKTAEVLPEAGGLEVDEVSLGFRVLPKDGHPIVGFDPAAPGLYFASMHSGVTMAPVMGMFAAMEILDDVEVNLLTDYRLRRFGRS